MVHVPSYISLAWLCALVCWAVVCCEGGMCPRRIGRMLAFSLACLYRGRRLLRLFANRHFCHGWDGCVCTKDGKQRWLLLVGLVTLGAAAVVHARPFCLVEAALAWLRPPAESPTCVQCCACACAIVES
jgi:hypothetical protein